MIRKFILIILGIVSVSCSPFGENKVLDYREELTDMASRFQKYKDGTYDRDEIEEFLIDDVRDLGIDLIVVNKGFQNQLYSGFVEENDSLIIFIKRSEGMFDNEKRIIYDFSEKPENYGDDKILSASYRIVQLDARWYYSEVGFD